MLNYESPIIYIPKKGDDYQWKNPFPKQKSTWSHRYTITSYTAPATNPYKTIKQVSRECCKISTELLQKNSSGKTWKSTTSQRFLTHEQIAKATELSIGKVKELEERLAVE